MSISRVQFQKLMSVKVLGEYPKVLNLHSGECYAIQDMTKTDRLAMLLKGRINVLTEKSFLHSIHPGEFLDSPEFESSKSSGRVDLSTTETTFKVTICAAGLSTSKMIHISNLEKCLLALASRASDPWTILHCKYFYCIQYSSWQCYVCHSNLAVYITA